MLADVPRHYPYLTRMVASLFAEGALVNVEAVEIEPEFGYVTRIRYKNGAFRLTRGNDVGLNSGAAYEVVKDKAYTKYFLQLSGIDCPRGASFLLGWWADHLRERLARHGVGSLRSADQAAAYVHGTLGFPVYVKPVDGSNGVNVWRVADDRQLKEVLALFELERVKVALIEEAVELPDYRLLVLDGELISGYRRNPLTVTGDGASTIAELLSALQESYRQQGRDTLLRAGDERILSRLQRIGLDWRSVPQNGTEVQLLDISNLSVGGTANDVTHVVSDRWKRLAATIASQFNLRFCGVDLACADIASNEGPYSVIEVNGAPGLDHYVSVGPDQEQIVRTLYLKVLDVPPQ